jgi:hypothetical protein
VEAADNEGEVAATAVETNEADSQASDTGETVPRRYPLRNRPPPIDPHHPYLIGSATGESPTLKMTAAKETEDWPLWQEASDAELRSLFEKGVHEDVPKPDVPEGKQVIPSKWVFDYNLRMIKCFKRKIEP